MVKVVCMWSLDLIFEKRVLYIRGFVFYVVVEFDVCGVVIMVFCRFVFSVLVISCSRY